jgi:membrane-associated phospholipid phosphatase
MARGLGERLRTRLGTKLGMLTVMAIGIVGPYFALQRWRPFPPREPFVTPLDALVPFDPGWAAAYLSVCLLVPLFPLLARRPDEIWRYGRGIGWLCVPCFACFLLLPMPGPRPELAPDGGLYGWLVGVDATWNAFPSLHAGLVAFSFLYGWRMLRASLPSGGRLALAAVSLLWAGAILYGTLATKQHWVVDLPAAFVLAFAAHRLAWRGEQGSRAPAAAEVLSSHLR